MMRATSASRILTGKFSPDLDEPHVGEFLNLYSTLATVTRNASSLVPT